MMWRVKRSRFKKKKSGVDDRFDVQTLSTQLKSRDVSVWSI
jgi:hypothetical protein